MSIQKICLKLKVMLKSPIVWLFDPSFDPLTQITKFKAKLEHIEGVVLAKNVNSEGMPEIESYVNLDLF